jgi:hypothetical protein
LAKKVFRCILKERVGHLKGASLEYALALITNIRLNHVRLKHTSLLQTLINYGGQKLLNIGPRLEKVTRERKNQDNLKNLLSHKISKKVFRCILKERVGHLKGASLGYALVSITNIRLGCARLKHTSLLQTLINYGC